jgi:hypothetical protein
MKIKRFNESYIEEKYLMTLEELRDIFLVLIDELDEELYLNELVLYGSGELFDCESTGHKNILDKKFESVIVCIPYNDIFKDIEPGYEISLDAYRRFNKKIDPIVDYIEGELIKKDF